MHTYKSVRIITLTKKTMLRLATVCLVYLVIGGCLAIVAYILSVTNAMLEIAGDIAMMNESRETDMTKPVDAKLAIIIDDFGSDRDGVKEMMAIDRHLTFAVLPFLQYSAADAEAAWQKGFEVIVHLPMEPYNGKPGWLGPKPILASMSTDEVKRVVADALKNIPHAKGANIHMGSKASSQENIIATILDVFNEHEEPLYFLDSMTSAKHLARKLSAEKKIPVYERDVFLDSTKSKETIKKNLLRAASLSLKTGEAIAIGHVGREGGRSTADAIRELLPEFDRLGVKLVFVSEMKSH